MKRLLLLFLLGWTFVVCAQSTITTVIFVRHAEKVADGSKDPELTPEGQARAKKLSEILINQRIDAIYSTDFKRTKGTVQPLADALGIKPSLYQAMTPELLRELIHVNEGGTVLICGHSNTTPAMINMLTGEDTFKQWEDADHGNLIIVSVHPAGMAKVTSLRY